MNKIKCIYAIKDKRSDKVLYIGQTKNFKNRKQHHFYTKTGQKIDVYMYQEDRENFEMFIIEELNPDISKEEMRNKEQYYIDFYDTYNNGFNERCSGNIFKKDKKKYQRNYQKKYLKNNEEYRDNKKEYQKEYREENKEYFKEYNKKYKEENKEYFKEYQKDYMRRYRLNKKQEKLNQSIL